METTIRRIEELCWPPALLAILTASSDRASNGATSPSIAGPNASLHAFAAFVFRCHRQFRQPERGRTPSQRVAALHILCDRPDRTCGRLFAIHSPQPLRCSADPGGATS